MLGAQFGIGSQATYPLQPAGHSPFGAHATGSYAPGNFVLPAILQSLQVAAQQLQQLQQLNFVQQQQLQQLQQWIQIVPQQIQQLQQQSLGQPSPFGLSPAPQLFTTQPGHVM
jgi:hypothetical protein